MSDTDRRFGELLARDMQIKTIHDQGLEIVRLTDALERIALLDEADGHELIADHAFRAVAIATSTLGKHPSVISAERHGRTHVPPEPTKGCLPHHGILLAEINTVAHSAGTNAYTRDLLKRAHRAIRDSYPAALSLQDRVEGSK